MFDPEECERLAAEMAEDDERATGERWGNDGIDVYTLTDSGQGFPMDRYPDSVDVIAGKCERCGERLGVLRADDELAIVRMRNNARSASSQLRAAVEEVERVGELYRDELHRNHGADRDRLAAEVERLTTALTKISAIRDSIVGMQGFNFSEHAYPLVAVLDGLGFKGAGYEIASKNLGTLIEQRDKAEADRDLLTSNIRALTEDLEKYKALVEQMRPVYEAVLKWREAQRAPWNTGWLIGFVDDEAMKDDEDTAAPKEEM